MHSAFARFPFLSDAFFLLTEPSYAPLSNDSHTPLLQAPLQPDLSVVRSIVSPRAYMDLQLSRFGSVGSLSPQFTDTFLASFPP
jgi:hypothetical protein